MKNLDEYAGEITAVFDESGDSLDIRLKTKARVKATLSELLVTTSVMVDCMCDGSTGEKGKACPLNKDGDCVYGEVARAIRKAALG